MKTKRFIYWKFAGHTIFLKNVNVFIWCSFVCEKRFPQYSILCLKVDYQIRDNILKNFLFHRKRSHYSEDI